MDMKSLPCAYWVIEVYRTFEPFEKRHLMHPSLSITRQNNKHISFFLSGKKAIAVVNSQWWCAGGSRLGPGDSTNWSLRKHELTRHAIFFHSYNFNYHQCSIFNFVSIVKQLVWVGR